ncbi:hypothetical protein ScPMuIL_017107 [Solemya velum]
MADYRTTMVLFLIQIVAMGMATAGRKKNPTQCQEEYDKCVKKQDYPEHECAFSKLECLYVFCHNMAKARIKSHTYIAILFVCATRHKIPVKMIQLLW